jgi:hypothetical protein
MRKQTTLYQKGKSHEHRTKREIKKMSPTKSQNKINLNYKTRVLKLLAK